MLIRLAVAILALVAVPAIADDRIELAKAVAVYKDAFEARSADDLVASLPQPVVARLAKERGSEDAKRMRHLRGALWEGLRAAIEGITLHGPSLQGEHRHPGNLHFGLDVDKYLESVSN